MTTTDQVKECELCGAKEKLYQCSSCGLQMCYGDSFYRTALTAKAGHLDYCRLCFNEADEWFRDLWDSFYDYE